jgi:hypothetical protein
MINCAARLGGAQYTAYNQDMVLVRIMRELPELSLDFTSAAGMCRENRRQTGSGTIVLLIKPVLLLHIIENH